MIDTSYKMEGLIYEDQGNSIVYNSILKYCYITTTKSKKSGQVKI